MPLIDPRLAGDDPGAAKVLFNQTRKLCASTINRQSRTVESTHDTVWRNGCVRSYLQEGGLYV